MTSMAQQLRDGGQVRHTGQGRSMLPLLRNKRDMVIIDPIGQGGPHIYDVVLFNNQGRYALHRVVKIQNGHYTMRGDGNWKAEHNVSAEAIYGVMTAFERNGKKVTVDNPSYQAYVRVWCALFPLRAPLLWASHYARNAARACYRFARSLYYG